MFEFDSEKLERVGEAKNLFKIIISHPSKALIFPFPHKIAITRFQCIFGVLILHYKYQKNLIYSLLKSVICGLNKFCLIF